MKNLNLKRLTAIKDSERICDMARVNKFETNGLFPYNSWEIKIWSNDHRPPHVHIKKDGWNVLFKIEDGELYDIEGEGKNISDLNYMKKNINEWFDSPNVLTNGKLTNREQAQALWSSLND